MLLATSAVLALSLAQVTVNDSTATPKTAPGLAFNEKRVTSQRHTAALNAPSWSATHPGLQAAIDSAAARSSSTPHFFWSGRMWPATSNAHGVLPRAIALAKARGGTTLEIALEGVPLPPYGDDDPDTEDIWQYASDAYTYASRGDAVFVRGESLRSGNVWEVYEYPQLKGNPAVRRVMQVLVHNDSMGAPEQIWPPRRSCDGVFFVERKVVCPPGVPLYYGPVARPVVTADTTIQDTKARISATGEEKGIARSCQEILRGDWVAELFENSGVCNAAASKRDGGRVMTRVKTLLSSPRNRNYVQEARFPKAAARVVGNSTVTQLAWGLIDSLIAIDYYEKTAGTTAALAREIDAIVSEATGRSPGVVSAWERETGGMSTAKRALLGLLATRVAELKRAPTRRPHPDGNMSQKPASA